MSSGVIKVYIVLLFFLITSVTLYAQVNNAKDSTKEKKMSSRIEKTDNEWKEVLSPEEFRVLRQKGTERPFTGKYWNTFDDGVYKCAACEAVLFDSNSKFDSGCGWPSFSDIINNKNIITKDDLSFGMHRIEVICGNCDGHLGHVFDDGPKPTGLRYCINSVSIKFEKKSN